MAIVVSLSIAEDDRKAPFDVSRVNALIADAKLSSKAEQFKRLFEDFQASKAVDDVKSDPMTMMLMKAELAAAEKRIMEKIEAEMKKRDEKLDQILRLLENMSH